MIIATLHNLTHADNDFGPAGYHLDKQNSLKNVTDRTMPVGKSVTREKRRDTKQERTGRHKQLFDTNVGYYLTVIGPGGNVLVEGQKRLSTSHFLNSDNLLICLYTNKL